jgi:hypothetical protein
VGAGVEGEAAIPTRARHMVQLRAAVGAMDAFLDCADCLAADKEIAPQVCLCGVPNDRAGDRQTHRDTRKKGRGGADSAARVRFSGYGMVSRRR